MCALWQSAFPQQARKLARQSRARRQAKATKANTFRQPKQRKRINPISAQMRQALKDYAKEKRLWKSEPQNQLCIVTGKPATDIHHTRGRRGDLLCLSILWLPVIRSVHDWIADNPDLARKAGLLCPAGKWNTTPTEAEIKEHLYRVALLRLVVAMRLIESERPKLLATKVCEQVELDLFEVSKTGFWLYF